MGGVNSNRPPDPTRVAFEKSTHELRSQFRATGKGLMITLPDNAAIAVNQYNCNGILRVLHAEGDTSTPDILQYLFVDNIKTGWKLSGSTGQAQMARTFFPRNLSQDDLIISGTMPNQHEYDKLVVFVEDHQKQILEKTDTLFGQDLLQVRGVEFTYVVPEARVNDTYHHGPRLIGTQFVVAITGIKAGHERFKFAPAYTLTCKVIDDRFYGLNEGEDAIIESLPEDFHTVDPLRNTSGILVFGNYYNPTPQEPVNYSIEVSTQRPRGVGTAGGHRGGGDSGGSGTCDRAAVFPGQRSNETDTAYADRVNPPPSGTGSNYAKGKSAPVRFPGPCMGPGSDNRHDLSYTKFEGGAYVDGAGQKYDEKGRKK